MAQEEIKYTIPSEGGGANDGRQVDVTVTYDPTAQNADGSYTITNASGTYAVLNDDGSLNHTDNITGINGVGQYSGTDDEIFLVSDPTTDQIVTNQGISFTIDNNADSDSATGNNGNVNFYNNSGSATAPSYIQYDNNDNPATDVSEAPAVCFMAGTLFATSKGNIAVERLKVGDLALCAAGAARPIRWLGHRTIDCRLHPRPNEVHPIRIAAHAFGENRPARDLFVSPGHAICVDVLGEVLIPAGALINGSTIARIDVDEVTYWHVELDSHDILLAENLPAESYIDMGNRGFFADGDVIELNAAPDADPAKRTHADFCRPFHADGALVDVVRAQLAKRAEAAGWSLARDLELHLLVDGQRVDPIVRDLNARFHMPADAKDVWLVSPAARPCDVMETADRRELGLLIGALRIDDGFDTREVNINDPLLCIGFHEVEDGARRWTSGRAKLPAALWEGCESDFYLRVELAGRPVPRWIGPVSQEPLARYPRLSVAA